MEYTPRYVPPLNFACVERELYRSGHPQDRNLSFIKSLKLNRVIFVIDDSKERKDDKYTDETIRWREWCLAEGIKFHIVSISEAVRLIREKGEAEREGEEAGPTLIHSLRGVEVVGKAIAQLRETEQWTISAIAAEYSSFGGTESDVL